MKHITASEALEGSIKKWRDIRDGKGKDEGAANCLLCTAFEECSVCLVTEKAGISGCSKTPYGKWYRHHRDEHQGGMATEDNPLTLRPSCPTCIEIAEEEVEFLKSLRPLVVEEEKGNKCAHKRVKGIPNWTPVCLDCGAEFPEPKPPTRPIHSPNQVLSVDELVVGGSYQRYRDGSAMEDERFVLLSLPTLYTFHDDTTTLEIKVRRVGSDGNTTEFLGDLGVTEYSDGGWCKNGYIERIYPEKEEIERLKAEVKEKDETITSLKDRARILNSMIYEAEKILRGS